MQWHHRGPAHRTECSGLRWPLDRPPALLPQKSQSRGCNLAMSMSGKCGWLFGPPDERKTPTNQWHTATQKVSRDSTEVEEE
ncbi:MAG: hypothetical protein WBC05_16015 [Sedimentisphaerales bacterium]